MKTFTPQELEFLIENSPNGYITLAEIMEKAGYKRKFRGISDVYLFEPQTVEEDIYVEISPVSDITEQLLENEANTFITRIRIKLRRLFPGLRIRIVWYDDDGETKSEFS